MLEITNIIICFLRLKSFISFQTGIKGSSKTPLLFSQFISAEMQSFLNQNSIDICSPKAQSNINETSY